MEPGAWGVCQSKRDWRAWGAWGACQTLCLPPKGVQGCANLGLGTGWYKNVAPAQTPQNFQKAEEESLWTKQTPCACVYRSVSARVLPALQTLFQTRCLLSKVVQRYGVFWGVCTSCTTIRRQDSVPRALDVKTQVLEKFPVGLCRAPHMLHI